MGQILHGSATTTYAVRAAIQRSKAPLKELATQTERFFSRKSSGR
jgi:Tfp pilus assembly protein PilE